PARRKRLHCEEISWKLKATAAVSAPRSSSRLRRMFTAQPNNRRPETWANPVCLLEPLYIGKPQREPSPLARVEKWLAQAKTSIGVRYVRDAPELPPLLPSSASAKCCRIAASPLNSKRPT